MFHVVCNLISAYWIWHHPRKLPEIKTNKFNLQYTNKIKIDFSINVPWFRQSTYRIVHSYDEEFQLAWNVYTVQKV